MMSESSKRYLRYDLVMGTKNNIPRERSYQGMGASCFNLIILDFRLKQSRYFLKKYTMKFPIACILACSLTVQTVSAGNLKRSKDSRLLLNRKLGNALLTGGSNPGVTFQPGCFDWGKYIYE